MLMIYHQDRSEYTAYTNKHILEVLHPVSARLSLPEQLKRKGVNAEKLDTVLFRCSGGLPIPHDAD